MITIKNLVMHYGKKEVLNIEKLEFKSGQTVGLLGQNGSGKSSLLKSVAHLLPFDSAQSPVIIDDVCEQNKMRDKIIYITEEYSFHPNYKLEQQAGFYADFFSTFDISLFFKLADMLDLPKNKKACNLSRGEKSKLEFIIGLSRKGKYIMIDEPFLGNDINTRTLLLNMMADQLTGEEIIIIATNLADQIENFVDRTVFLSHGKIMGDYLVDALRSEGTSIADIYNKILQR